MSDWRFYGRGHELAALRDVLERKRWFFARITGRRRIGKTTLIQEALRGVPREAFYVQIPDSGPAGVLSAFADALQTFEIDEGRVPRPNSLHGLAAAIRTLIELGVVVVLDEFQYFSRKRLTEFNSHLQAVVDDLTGRAGQIQGGLFVLGSLHTELVALLDDRDAPLFNRTTDHFELDHLDIASVRQILAAHGGADADRLLFFWNLFEGVPKFYRDCYEHDVLSAHRADVLRAMFFRSSSPLRNEADSWFLSELRGRYDVVLKYVARNPGCTNGDITSHVNQVSREEEQVAGYLKILIDKYRMIERRSPVFAKANARNGRYYISDNFLRSWLGAIASAVSAIHFRPEAMLVEQADQELMRVEGYGLEKLVAQIYQELSRRALGDFLLTERFTGYWDRAGTEIDLIAINEDERRLRLGTCKRNPDKLIADLGVFDGHVQRFLADQRRFAGWSIERIAIAPVLDEQARAYIAAKGYRGQDLGELLAPLESIS